MFTSFDPTQSAYMRANESLLTLPICKRNWPPLPELLPAEADSDFLEDEWNCRLPGSKWNLSSCSSLPFIVLSSLLLDMDSWTLTVRCWRSNSRVDATVRRNDPWSTVIQPASFVVDTWAPSLIIFTDGCKDPSAWQQSWIRCGAYFRRFSSDTQTSGSIADLNFEGHLHRGYRTEC